MPPSRDRVETLRSLRDNNDDEPEQLFTIYSPAGFGQPDPGIEAVRNRDNRCLQGFPSIADGSASEHNVLIETSVKEPGLTSPGPSAAPAIVA